MTIFNYILIVLNALICFLVMALCGGQDKQDNKLLRMGHDLENITGKLGELRHDLNILIVRIELLYRR